jgi:pilus assembly protein FimV
MAFNKNKALESALKFLNQGKVAQAISEYRQILRHDAKDQATLMTVGDLYARQGDMPNAIEYFERLAQVYLADGFNSKAIAIYKKIAKLAPNELAPLERLADLYVQQGVLSEARPLYLQIAEAHLKANRAPKAVEVLHRLLEIEPESPRVQMRLAELYNVLGQKKEAAETYSNYAQRLLERGEAGEAEKLADRAIAVDGSNPAALLLKGKCLVALNKTNEAIAIFEKHPEADTGGDVTNLIVDLEVKAGQVEKAADRARNQLLRGSSHYALLQHVAEVLVESGHGAQALPLLTELRDPMTEAGEQDKYVKSLTTAAERMPDDPAPLEALADFCRTNSDPSRLTSTLAQLAEIYSASGDHVRFEAIAQELIESNKDDERLSEKLQQLRTQEARPAQKQSAPKAEPRQREQSQEQEEVLSGVPFVDLHAEPQPKMEKPTPVGEEAAAGAPEEPLDEETQKFIAQALTDVDLFSSYGLTQKATNLLETVLERAPRHTPTLERLLDFYLGAGNERRTAELASQLEQIYTQRGDSHNAERFSELRMRFQAAAGMSEEELPSAPPVPAPVASASAATADQAPPKETPVAPAPSHAGLAEFQISAVSAEEEHEPVAPVQTAATAVPAASAPPAVPSPQPSAASEEVDLSDEWEAMLKDSTEAPAESAPAKADAKQQSSVGTPESAEEFVIDADALGEPEAELASLPAAHEDLDPVVEVGAERAQEARPEATAPAEEFEFELVEETKPGKAGVQSTDDMIDELVAELDSLEPPSAPPVRPSKPAGAPTNGHRPAEVVASVPPAAPSQVPLIAASSAPPIGMEALDQLSEVFQEFRNDIGEESADENEDLETHYNLGIAYREMGLLDEAIGEFQKVAKAIQKGKPFSYAMNCSTLLALSFADKGEPKIAAMWYQRALDTPGLDQESVLALRYDLGISLEQAGESRAALDSFRQVYAMNIDYRDVADRIAVLQRR